MTDTLTDLRAERDRLIAAADLTPVRDPRFFALRARIADVCDEIAAHLYGPDVIDRAYRARLTTSPAGPETARLAA